MLRRALASMLAAIGLFGSSAAGCKKESKPPFYEPPSSSEDRDAAQDAESAAPVAPVVHAPHHVGCDDGPELHVLFIGNSHTYTNDLPSLVRDLACDAGTKLISQQVTPGGVGFVEHSTNPDTLAAIDADAWDFVVMQDQQQRPGFRLDEVESDDLPAAKILVKAIRAHRKQTRPLFYMVWARNDGNMQDCAYYPLLCSVQGATLAVADGYRLYAERTRSELAPVALAWGAVLADAKSPIAGADLWMADGSHPQLSGSYLAAAVLTRIMLDEKTAELTYAGGLDKPIAAYLRGVADRIVAEQRADVRAITTEHVRIACEYSGECSDDADAAAVTFMLSSDDCKALKSGSATVLARLPTHASCRAGQCITVPLGEWHDVSGGAIEDGTYQVLAHVDVNGNRDIDRGDLVACGTGNLVIGSGEDLTFAEFSVR
jgi:hypothetical protein